MLGQVLAAGDQGRLRRALPEALAHPHQAQKFLPEQCNAPNSLRSGLAFQVFPVTCPTQHWAWGSLRQRAPGPSSAGRRPRCPALPHPQPRAQPTSAQKTALSGSRLTQQTGNWEGTPAAPVLTGHTSQPVRGLCRPEDPTTATAGSQIQPPVHQESGTGGVHDLTSQTLWLPSEANKRHHPPGLRSALRAQAPLQGAGASGQREAGPRHLGRREEIGHVATSTPHLQ